MVIRGELAEQDTSQAIDELMMKLVKAMALVLVVAFIVAVACTAKAGEQYKPYPKFPGSIWYDLSYNIPKCYDDPGLKFQMYAEQKLIIGQVFKSSWEFGPFVGFSFIKNNNRTQYWNNEAAPELGVCIQKSFGPVSIKFYGKGRVVAYLDNIVKEGNLTNPTDFQALVGSTGHISWDLRKKK